MSFKDKPLKKINGDNRVTIDVIHNDLIKDFNSKEEEWMKKLEGKSERDIYLSKNFKSEFLQLKISFSK